MGIKIIPINFLETRKYKKIILKDDAKAVGVDVCEMIMFDITPFKRKEAFPEDKAKIIKINKDLSNFGKIFLIVKNKK